MPVVDIHTHVYLPAFVELLGARKMIAYIRKISNSDTARLIILPDEDDPTTPSTSLGRPVGAEHWNVGEKLASVDVHGIDMSIVFANKSMAGFFTVA